MIFECREEEGFSRLSFSVSFFRLSFIFPALGQNLPGEGPWCDPLILYPELTLKFGLLRVIFWNFRAHRLDFGSELAFSRFFFCSDISRSVGRRTPVYRATILLIKSLLIC